MLSQNTVEGVGLPYCTERCMDISLGNRVLRLQVFTRHLFERGSSSNKDEKPVELLLWELEVEFLETY